MPTTREQALKTRDTNLNKDPDYYRKNGKRGGETITENTHKRGFGSMTPERRREIAQKGAATRLANWKAKNG